MRSLKHAPRASSCGEVPSRSQDRSFDGGMSVAKERVYGLCLPKHWALRHHLVAKPHGPDHERPAPRQEDTGGDAKAQVGKHQDNMTDIQKRVSFRLKAESLRSSNSSIGK